MKDNNCIFCKIANGEIPSSTLYEDDDFRVILDISPASKGHALILPKEHYNNIGVVPNTLSCRIPELAAKIGIASQKALGASGYNILVNTGESAGQTVFHCHIHIIPRYDNEKGILTWSLSEKAKENLKNTLNSMKEALVNE